MQSAPSLNVVSQKHLSRAPSAGLLAFHAVLSIDILPTRRTGSGQPDCCCVFVAGVVFAAVSGLKIQTVQHLHVQNFPMERYAGPWLPSCWIIYRSPVLRVILTLPGTPPITPLSTKDGACFLMTRHVLTV